MMLFPHFSWSDFFLFLFNSVYWITLIGVMLVVILDNRNPVKTISWMLVLFFLPYVGIILYIFFGQRYRKQKIISRKSIRSIENNPAYLYEELDPAHYPAECTGLIEMFRECNAHPVFSGNSVELFTDGREKFDRLFEDIRKARKHIHLDYYIIEQCKIGYELQHLLIEKAKEGVEVRLIYDDIGSWKTKKRFFREMQDAGVQVYPFLKVLLPYLSPKFNYRNHRKIVVIDGEIGYTGGFNVADRYIDGGNFAFWRDSHVRIEGKAVYGLQTAFLIDWFFVSRSLLTSKYYFPDLNEHGNCLVQTVTSGPDTDWENIMQGIFSVLTKAKKYVYIQTPYFLPNESLLTALQTAALSGVDVRLMVPAKSDTWVALKGMQSYLAEIMEAGVKVYFYQDGFLHAKTLVSDDIISTVGSTNLDYRSFEFNFEMNAFIYNKDFGKKMKSLFLKDQEQCRLISLKDWENRPRLVRWSESICRLFGPLL
ncbi:MAG: cardiolipin synthase [Bacteroidales bacterium]|nr:cardiolipin synthase [Bacteroidales bacterium]